MNDEHSMIHLELDNIDVSEFITAYSVKSSADSSDTGAFENWDGSLVGKNGSIYKNHGGNDDEQTAAVMSEISVSLAGVPRDTADGIAAVLSKSSFDIIYDSPAKDCIGTGETVSYKASAKKFGDSWDIEISLAVTPASDTPDDGL